MEQRLDVAARAGDIDALYSLMKEDAYLLERIEEVPFIDTPLHVAASAGQVHFAMEIMRLKASFARKLNQNGYSPIHLALQNEQTKVVLRLLDVDTELVRVQGREGKTPLHFAAECGMIDLLAEFLSACPKSIQDLTIRKETALHVAIKSDKLEALEVDGLSMSARMASSTGVTMKEIPSCMLLHLGIKSGSRLFAIMLQMVSLLIGRIDINAKNLAGLTALDVSQNQPQPESSKLRRMLLRGGARRALSLPTIPKLADSLKSNMSWQEKWIVSNYRQKLYLSNEDRNVILLVAVLFATANYEAALDSYKDNEYANFVRILFKLINNIAFLASMVEIYLYLPTDCGILRLVLPLVICNYAVINSMEWSPKLMPLIFVLLILFYYSKWAIIIHRCVPILVKKKVVKMKIGLFKRFSGFHKDFME
ncbi:hypothetical protein TIFTF001_003031 [Ficus carica]|uniref:Uncharacterized protein n=1 Tax=Ficus carica TaxID=3494 RepID=A0AA88CV32_FICCA|nr:hypothetical protein TIFTF001_003031 [Ficus carica]